jgi:hypothetical protein
MMRQTSLQNGMFILSLIIILGGYMMDTDNFAHAATTGKAVTLQLKPEKPSYAAGSIPDFIAVIKNSGTIPVKICTYMLEYRLKAGMAAHPASGKGTNFELRPFAHQTWPPAGENVFKELKPGEELKVELNLSHDRCFAFIQKHDQIPVIARSFAISGFPAGDYEFDTCIFDQISIYVGEEGVFDFKRESKYLDELPGGKDPEVFLDEEEGKVHVTFK